MVSTVKPCFAERDSWKWIMPWMNQRGRGSFKGVIYLSSVALPGKFAFAWELPEGQVRKLIEKAFLY